MRLHAEHLVELAPLREFAVAKLSLKEMWDTTNLRILLECEALCLSIENGGDDWEAGIVSSLHALTLQSQRRLAQDDGSLWELEKRHYDFHRQLISACGSTRMLEFFERLYVDSDRYRTPVLLAGGAKRGRLIQAEYTAIADATIARKADAAAKLLAAHYRLTAESIEQLEKKGNAQQISQNHLWTDGKKARKPCRRFNYSASPVLVTSLGKSTRQLSFRVLSR